MRLLLGLLLGLALAAALPFIQAVLEALRISPKDDAYQHAFFLVVLVLLSILVLRPARRRRVVEPRYDEYEPVPLRKR